MHEIVFSDSAQRAFESFSHEQQDEFREICHHLAESFEILRGIDWITRYSLWGVPSFRYFDNRFPYLIFFDRATMGSGNPRTVIEVRLILAAPTLPDLPRT